MLEIAELTKQYRNGTLANDGISLSVARGEVYGLLGPNGAGKTTLVRQVLGMLRPTSGSIKLDGVDIVANPGHARKTIGFLPQGQFNMEAIRVEELVLGIARLRGLRGEAARARTAEVLARLDLEPFRATAFSAASGGVRRLTGFACAIVAASPVLVLDEPTNDVDPVRRGMLWRCIGELGAEGTTVLLVTHNLAEAERVIDRFAIIDRGRILNEGTPAGLRSLVTDRLRLEVTANAELEPHPALVPDPLAADHFLFDQRDLVAVSGWVQALRERGDISDFRIGPPTLDDIYTVAVGHERPVAEVPA